ncbi:MAG: transcription antitermination factor NusB [Planctomycetaceae bacterium]|nr:transcription antitermination factor NusB [Planctomycetaceae bacterium]
MSGRSLAREIIVQVLFEDDLNPDGDPDRADQFVTERLQGTSAGLAEFTRVMIDDLRQSRSLVDSILEESSENWTLSRMAPTDRNILRLGVYELTQTDTPGPVVIHEAVELAKRFGTEDSPRFVNGVLDHIFGGADSKD